MCGAVAAKKGMLMRTKTALITGASGGIGAALAEAAAEDCGTLVVTGRKQDRLFSLKADLEKKSGAQVVVLNIDLAQKGAAEAIDRELQNRGLVPDYLINNAGFGDLAPFAQSNWPKLEEMIAVNITALTHLTRLVLPAMISRGSGAILNVASTAAFQPGPFMSVYYASKAYVLSFTEALAVELKGTGVTATVLCPGPTATAFGAASGMDRTRLVRHTRLASPRDVARFGYAAMKRGRTVAIPGLLNKLSAFSTRFGPRKLVAMVVGALHQE
jgi:short-subunit dehydrogenase